jgi:hypothetical protein
MGVTSRHLWICRKHARGAAFFALALVSCTQKPAGLPPGPPPEYERPALSPWGGDAGTPSKGLSATAPDAARGPRVP